LRFLGRCRPDTRDDGPARDLYERAPKNAKE